MEKILKSYRNNNRGLAISCALLALLTGGILLYGFTSDTESFSSGTVVMGFSIACGTSIALMIFFACRTANMEPIYKLFPRGKAEYEEMCLDLENPLYNEGEVIIGSKYMVSAKAHYKGSVVDLSKLAMVYKSILQTKVNGINAGRTYKVVFHEDGRKNYKEFQMGEEQVHKILIYLANNFPDVIIGYRKELVKKWYKNPSKTALRSEE